MSIASHADWGDRANPEGIVGYSWDQGLIEKEMAVEEFVVRLATFSEFVGFTNNS